MKPDRTLEIILGGFCHLTRRGPVSAAYFYAREEAHMVNLENWNRLKQRQPVYQVELAETAKDYLVWLKSRSIEEPDVLFQRKIRRLRTGLLNHEIINNFNVTTTLIEDLELLVRNA